MTRFLGTLFVLILGWFGFLSTAEAVIAVPTPSIVPAYEYDGHHGSPELTFATTAGGPPSRACGHTPYDAVDRWSHGAAVRSGRDATPGAYTYNDLAEPGQVVKTAVTTSEIVPGIQRILALATQLQVAANTGTRSGLPRDALGRFTSGAGGESAAAAAGRTAHANYANTLGGGNYVFNRALPGSRLRPDAVDFTQNIVRELKPGTPSGISRGWRQVNEYKAYLEELTGQPWTAYVDVYTP